MFLNAIRENEILAKNSEFTVTKLMIYFNCLFQLFKGNENTYLTELREVSPPIVGRQIRFIPYSRNPRTVCMRVELYGCKWEGKLCDLLCFLHFNNTMLFQHFNTQNTLANMPSFQTTFSRTCKCWSLHKCTDWAELSQTIILKYGCR